MSSTSLTALASADCDRGPASCDTGGSGNGFSGSGFSDRGFDSSWAALVFGARSIVSTSLPRAWNLSARTMNVLRISSAA
jgi:hypothetical protein